MSLPCQNCPAYISHRRIIRQCNGQIAYIAKWKRLILYKYDLPFLTCNWQIAIKIAYIHSIYRNFNYGCCQSIGDKRFPGPVSTKHIETCVHHPVAKHWTCFVTILYTIDISQSNLTLHRTRYEMKKAETLVRLWSHKRHPIPRPFPLIIRVLTTVSLHHNAVVVATYPWRRSCCVLSNSSNLGKDKVYNIFIESKQFVSLHGDELVIRLFLFSRHISVTNILSMCCKTVPRRMPKVAINSSSLVQG